MIGHEAMYLHRIMLAGACVLRMNEVERTNMRIREATLDFARNYPVIFYKLMRLRRRYRELLINADTEVVIEGYPRSANTFAVAAFQIAQARAIQMGRHTHAIAQLKEAVRRGLPTIVLIRKPVDAVSSYVIREPAVDVGLAIRRYINYYEAVRVLRRGILIAEFNTVTSDFGSIIAKLNQKYATDYFGFTHTEEQVEAVFGRVEEMERADCNGVLLETRVARPSGDRVALKKSLAATLNKPRYVRQLQVCNSLYEELTACRR